MPTEVPPLVEAHERPSAPTVDAGDPAPWFAAKDADGSDFDIADLRGQWVVLYFYPEDHTIGCTMEAKAFRDYFEAISLHEAAIVGVSRDNAGNHCSFRDKHALPFKLLCDEAGAVLDLYGAWKKAFLRPGRLAPRRCTFIIDPDGNVAKVYPTVNPVGHAQQVVRDLPGLVRLYNS